MKYLIKIFFTFSIFVPIASLQSQNVIPATGGNASGTGGSSSYTVGQVAYTSVSGSTGTINQGVQQPYEISEITAIEEASGITLECSVYPNPASDFLTLKIKDYDSQNLSYLLLNINGNLIEKKKIMTDEVQINMGNLVTGIYFLKVTDGNRDIKTFKTIKN